MSGTSRGSLSSLGSGVGSISTPGSRRGSAFSLSPLTVAATPTPGTAATAQAAADAAAQAAEAAQAAAEAAAKQLEEKLVQEAKDTISLRELSEKEWQETIINDRESSWSTPALPGVKVKEIRGRLDRQRWSDLSAEALRGKILQELLKRDKKQLPKELQINSSGIGYKRSMLGPRENRGYAEKI